MLLRISTVRAPDGSMRIEAVHEYRRKADKKACASGRTRWLGRPRENFQEPAMLKTASLDCEPKAT